MSARRKMVTGKDIKKRLRASEDQDPKISSTSDPLQKLIVSPGDNNMNKLNKLTEKQEDLLLNKIIMQMEKNKLKEAKKKDKSKSFRISLQPINEGKFIISHKDKRHIVKAQENSEPNRKPEPNKMKRILEESLIPFNDNDEMYVGPMPPQGDFMSGPFFLRDGMEMRKFPGPSNWKGDRGGRSLWENPPRMTVRSWNQPATWRHLPPHQHQRKYPPQQLPHPIDFPLTRVEELPVSSDIEPKDHLPSGAVNDDEIKTIVIDGVPKDIRFYGELGITFISWDDPRELTFQDDVVRQITFNNKESYTFSLNHSYKEVLVNGRLHKVKIGAPSREIFIDHVPYECRFGSAIRIDLDGVSITLKLEGLPPQVKIGDTKRTDLVAGKINVCIDAEVVPVFLDAKVQKFVLNGETHTLKFVNALETVLINDVPFNVEYGGLPEPIVINGKQHSIRFPVLPKGTKPGKVNIRDMEGNGNISPKFDKKSQESNSDTRDPALPIYRNLLQQENMSEWSSQNDMIPTLASIPKAGAHQVENQSNPDVPKSGTTTSEPIPIMNVGDLFQKLVAFGFITSTDQQNPPVSQEPMDENPPSSNKEISVEKPIAKPIFAPTLSKLRRNSCEKLRPIKFEQPKTLKVRQNVLYSTLYSGMQCGSCGMRFSPEASMQYSQHLDWHFRKNRRGKRNNRVANSRRWYYSLSDWKNYEEIEDVKEREKNYFDQQQQQADNVGVEAEEYAVNPSVSADPESTDECCDVCRDKFDYFFNEEKEEWHLKNAIRIEDKTYHPLCYEDYQQSLLDQTADESRIQSPKLAKQEETTIPGLEIILDVDDEDEDNNDVDTEPMEVVSLESDESKQVQDENDKTEQPLEKGGYDNNDDVILNEVAPIVIVVDDDEEMGQDGTESEMNNNTEVKRDSMDDGFVEVSCLVSLQIGKQMKIKAEPVDLGEFINQEALTGALPEEQPEEQLKEIPLSQTELLTNMDGNIELLFNTSSVPTSRISCNKIKINISKSLPVINKEKESVVESETPSETYIDPFEPIPPGEEPEAALKPSLKNIKLSKLPPVRKGHELTGLCAVM
ncbi:uncharacterized protein isoform X2 [Leptinotarsa decemlineata]|uniref:uncharacterized protein isoform X2 n=1 Tax=Leptinotarsa decemlineata TaxID=7539 RepID=UPI003D303FC5